MRLPPISLILAFALLFHSPLTAQETKSDAEPASIRLALLPDAPAVDAATQASLLKWLAEFQTTIYRMRIRDYLTMVDWDALIAASTPEEPEPLSDSRKLALKKALMLANERTFPVIRTFFLFKDAEIRRIDITGDRAAIVARIHDEDDAENKVRWWLQRHGDQWRLTDFESISVNVRLSSLLLMGMEAASSKEGMRTGQGAKFAQIGIAIQDGELEKANQLIEELEKSKLPAVMQEVFLAIKVSVFSQLEGKEEALDTALAELEKISPLSPVLLLMRTAESYDADDYKNTLFWGKKLGSTIGHDEDSWEMVADAHRELGEEKEHLAAAEGWAADYPNSPAALWRLWQTLPPDQREARLKPLLEHITPAQEGLTGFADDAFLEDDLPALKLALALMQTRKLPAETLKEYQSNLQELLTAPKPTEPEKK